MARTESEKALAEALARRTGTRPEDWFFVFKARYGMQVVFEAAGSRPGARAVTTQLFTCCTAVAPILAAGLEPRYAEISERSASIDPARLGLLGDEAAVVLQHTFGIIDDAESRQLAALVHGAGLPLVEDCAHCVGRLARDAAGAPLADFSIHSFGVEKILDTMFGGAVWVNPDTAFADLAGRVRGRLAGLDAPGARLSVLSRVYRTENRVLAHLPGAVSRPLRRGLARAGLLEPAVSEQELSGTLPYGPLAATDWICARAASAVARLDEMERTRCQTVAALAAELSAIGGLELLPAAVEGAPQPLLRMPVLARSEQEADGIIERVNAAGYYAQAWYRPLLGPGVHDEAAYRVPASLEASPVLGRMTETVAALPADVGEEGARAIARAVAAVVSS